MMNMQNANCCNGCFYAGVVNGYKPDCNCMKAAEAKARDNKSANTDMLNSWNEWDQYIFDKESDFVSTKDRSKAVRRRINRAKARKNAVKVLPIVKSKANKIPAKRSTGDLHFIADKKCDTAKKVAKRRYQLNITISFPDIPEKNYGGRLWHMINHFNSWQYTATRKGNNDMELACKNAISTLETAKSCGGELSSLHRDGNVLHVRIGFRDKISMLNFKQRTSLGN